MESNVTRLLHYFSYHSGFQKNTQEKRVQHSFYPISMIELDRRRSLVNKVRLNTESMCMCLTN